MTHPSPAAPPPLLLRGARVIDPASGRDASSDIAIDRGRIAAIGLGLDAPADAEIVDAAGLIACPGLVDPHVHLREPGQTHKESVQTGSHAAAAGGFTAVCCMPNTSPPLDTPEVLESLRVRASGAACRVFPVGCGTLGRRGETVAPIAALVRAGAVAISDDGDAIADAGVMAAVLRETAEAGVVFMQHCQEPALTRGAAMHAGEVSLRLGLTGWPRVAEELILERDVRLVAAMPDRERSRYHAQHLSSAGSVEILRRARETGLPVSGEVSPHHLTLTCDACAGPDGHTPDAAAKMNPPLREQADINALRQAVAEGVIDILATDHAPHHPDEKALPFEEAPFGIVGLETALALYAEALVHSGLIGWPRLIELMTVNPARLCGLDRCGVGRLEVGGLGDVTLIDPDQTWTIGLADLAGMSRNTPFLGRTVRGRAVLTVCGGRVTHTTFDALRR